MTLGISVSKDAWAQIKTPEEEHEIRRILRARLSLMYRVRDTSPPKSSDAEANPDG